MATDHDYQEHIQEAAPWLGKDRPPAVSFKERMARKAHHMQEVKRSPILKALILERVASGMKIKKVAELMQVRYTDLYHWLTKECEDDLKLAKEAYAEELAYGILDDAEDVRTGDMDPKAAKVSSDMQRWFVERAGRDVYGQQSTTNINIGLVGMHVEAIRALARQESQEAIEGEWKEANEIEVTEEEEKPSTGHPLL